MNVLDSRWQALLFLSPNTKLRKTCALSDFAVE